MKDDPDITLTLKLSSWENLFHVLNELGVGPFLGGTEGDEIGERILKEHGVRFSLRDFWMQIQTFKTQVDQWKEKQSAKTEEVEA